MPAKHRGKWKGGKMVDKNGYILIWKPDHPYVSRTGYVREHRLIMEKHLGRYLTPKEVIHHIDGDRSNNDLTNLRLFSCNGEHTSLEMKGVNKSELQKQRTSTKLMGHIVTEDVKKKLREANLGKKHSPESRKKMGEASRRWWATQALTSEHKQTRSES